MPFFPGMSTESAILTRQASNLERAIANYILFLYRQGTFLDLGNALDIVHGTDDADRHFDISIGKRTQIFDCAKQEVSHFIVSTSRAEESSQSRRKFRSMSNCR